MENNMNRPDVDVDSILDQVAVETVRRLVESEERARPRDVRVSRQELEFRGDAIPQRLGSQLPHNFAPSPNHVIVGRGREAKTNPGNEKLRTITMTYLDQYSQAKNDKETKCRIISTIVAMVNDACGGGGFIKRNNNTGQWYQVETFASREKVGCLLRDLLSDKYRSSSKSKVARRQQSRQQSELQQCISNTDDIVEESNTQKAAPRTEMTDRSPFLHKSSAYDVDNAAAAPAALEDSCNTVEFPLKIFEDQALPRDDSSQEE